jgi:hypothetical protein
MNVEEATSRLIEENWKLSIEIKVLPFQGTEREHARKGQIEGKICRSLSSPFFLVVSLF